MPNVYFGTSASELWVSDAPLPAAPPPPARPRWPDLTVQIGSDANPSAHILPTAWTTIARAGQVANHIRAINIKRRESEDEGIAEPAEMVLRLDDRNGFLNSLNPNSPYKALLTEGRWLRVVHTRSDGSTTVLFAGNVGRWPISWPTKGQDVTVELLVIDILAQAGTARSPASVLEYEVLRGVRYPRPVHLYLFGENDITSDVNLADTMGDLAGRALGRGGLARVDAGALVPFVDGAGAIQGSGSGGKGLVRFPASLIPGFTNGEFTVAFVANIPEDTTDTSRLISSRTVVLGDGGLVSQGFAFGADDASLNGQIETFAGVQYVEGGVTKARLPSPTTPVEAGSHLYWLLVGRVDFPTDAIFVQVDDSNYTGWAVTNLDAPFDNLFRFPYAGKGTTAGLLMVWAKYVNHTQRSACFADIYRPWAGESVNARVDHLVDVTLPGLVRRTEPSGVVMLPAKPAGRPLLELLRRTVQAAGGLLHGDLSGSLVSSPQYVDVPVPLRTYGVGGAPVLRASPAGDVQRITTVRVVNEAGTIVEYHDTGASLRYGQGRLELKDLPLVSPAEMWYLAERMVHHSLARGPHIGSVEVLPADPAVGWDDTLARDLYDVVGVAYNPPYGGATVTDVSRVIGLEHDADSDADKDWTTTLDLRPARQQRLRLDAATGAATTPDSTASSITGDIDIRARFLNYGGGAGTFRTLVVKGSGDAVNDKVYHLALNPEQGLRFRAVWADGSSAFVDSPRVLFTDVVRPLWARATYAMAAALLSLYVSDDGAAWRRVASFDYSTGAGVAMRDTTAPVAIGAYADGTLPLGGEVLYAEVRNGIDGPVVVSFDPTANAGKVGATSWKSSTGETWTVNAGATVEVW